MNQHIDTQKWQRMQHIVDQQSTLLQVNPINPFKKLFFSRLVAENLLIILLQYSGLMFSTFVPFPSLLWYASGTACGFIFMRGYRILPSIGFGSFIAYYVASFPVGIAAGCALVYTLQTGFLLWLCYRYLSPTLLFYQFRIFIQFILCTSFITAVASLLLMMICYSSFSLSNWLLWWLANFNGLLIFSCSLVALDAYFPQMDYFKHQDKRMLYLLFGLLLLVFFIVVCSPHSDKTLFFALCTLPLIILISLRFHWCGTLAGVFLLGFLFNLAAALGAPLFHTPFSLSTTYCFQLGLLLETVLGLSLAIVAHKHT